jgi:hypothetical protein
MLAECGLDGVTCIGGIEPATGQPAEQPTRFLIVIEPGVHPGGSVGREADRLRSLIDFLGRFTGRGAGRRAVEPLGPELGLDRSAGVPAPANQRFGGVLSEGHVIEQPSIEQPLDRAIDRRPIVPALDKLPPECFGRLGARAKDAQRVSGCRERAGGVKQTFRQFVCPRGVGLDDRAIRDRDDRDTLFTNEDRESGFIAAEDIHAGNASDTRFDQLGRVWNL